MKAWQFTSVGSPLKLVEMPDPEPGPGEVIVDLMAAGLCHTDVGIMDGTLTEMIGFTPMVLGHEAAGVVSAIGAGVTTAAVGDRVAHRRRAMGKAASSASRTSAPDGMGRTRTRPFHRQAN